MGAIFASLALISSIPLLFPVANGAVGSAVKVFTTLMSLATGIVHSSSKIVAISFVQPMTNIIETFIRFSLQPSTAI